MASLTISGPRAPTLVSLGPDHIPSCFPGISSNTKCPRYNTCTCGYFLQRSFLPALCTSANGTAITRLQPCNHPCSPSPYPPTPSVRPAALPPNHILPTHPAPSRQQLLFPYTDPWHQTHSSHPHPFPLTKFKTQPPFSSQLNVSFSKKPPCPMSKSVLNGLNTPCCPFGAHIQEPLSNALTNGVMVLFSLTI